MPPRVPACATLALLVLPGCFVDDILAQPAGDGGVVDADADASEDASADAHEDGPAPECVFDADCDDHNPCTLDACIGGTCHRPPALQGVSCDDGDLCNGVAACDGAGVCAPGAPPVVDDGNPCTTDTCDAMTGMVTHTLTPACAAPITVTAAPAPRTQHTAVWTGTQMVLWGGTVPGMPAVTATGGRYDPVASAWSPTTTTGAPPARHSHCAVWTGSHMLVWGGFGTSALETTGGSYDPAADAWTPLATLGAPSGRIGFSCVWTGTELLVWGGISGGSVVASGGRYDPATDTWKPLPGAGAPNARYDQSAVWTGSRMVVWGGNDTFNWHSDGASFDPVAGAWAGVSAMGAPSPREQHTGLWTGSRMVIWGGFSGGPYLDDGGSLDPSAAGAGAWTALSVTGAPSPRTEHAGVWAGDRMVVWGGCGMDSCTQLYADGGAWTPDAGGGTWKPIPAVAGVEPRRDPTAVWTGSVVLLWGGNATKGPTNTGAVYYP